MLTHIEERRLNRLIEQMNESARNTAHDSRGVYFVRCEGFVKIGYATKLSSRLASLRIGNPFELHLLYFIPANPKQELQLHTVLRPEWHAGEWFMMGERLNSILAQLGFANLPRVD